MPNISQPGHLVAADGAAEPADAELLSLMRRRVNCLAGRSAQFKARWVQQIGPHLSGKRVLAFTVSASRPFQPSVCGSDRLKASRIINLDTDSGCLSVWFLVCSLCRPA